MKAPVIRVILAGILGGVALFLMPFFLIRIVVFFLLISIIFRLLRPHGRKRTFGYCHSNSQYSERWRNMSHDERRAFKAKMEKEFFSEQDSTSTHP